MMPWPTTYSWTKFVQTKTATCGSCALSLSIVSTIASTLQGAHMLTDSKTPAGSTSCSARAHPPKGSMVPVHNPSKLPSNKLSPGSKSMFTWSQNLPVPCSACDELPLVGYSSTIDGSTSRTWLSCTCRTTLSMVSWLPNA